MHQMLRTRKTALAIAISATLILSACGGSDGTPIVAVPTNPWMTASILAEQAASSTDSAKEGIANKRAKLLIAAMTLEQKMAQLTGAVPEVIPELPACKGGRHVPASQHSTSRLSGSPTARWVLVKTIVSRRASRRVLFRLAAPWSTLPHTSAEPPPRPPHCRRPWLLQPRSIRPLLAPTVT